jgi:PKD repeat protein
LAPDGKIYINSNNRCSYLHVINEPDSLGLACEVCQHCVDLPSVNAFSMPNFPNYRLGHLEGSPCDTLRQPPVAAWRYEPGGLSVAFEDESYHDIRSWRWDFGDGATDSLPAPVHEYAAAGAYEVCLTVSNPRGSDTRCQVVEVVPSSSREAVAGRRLWVGPNPAQGQVHLRWQGAAAQPGQAIAYDAYGRQVRSVAIMPGSAEAVIDVGRLPDGLYIIRIRLDGEDTARRIIVKR